MSETDCPTPITDSVFGTNVTGERSRACRNLERQLAAALDQRDRLAEALAGLIPTDARPMECDSQQLKAARAILAAVKGGNHE